jgi:hypothetical protein
MSPRDSHPLSTPSTARKNRAQALRSAGAGGRRGAPAPHPPHLAARLEGPHQRQRHDHRPRPRRHAVEIDRKPVGQQHHLGRHGGARRVGHLTEQGEVEPCEAVDRPRPPRGFDRPAGPHERGRAGIVAEELEHEVGLHARADVDGPPRIDRPTAARKLLVENPANAALDLGRVDLVRPGEEKEVLAFEDRVALERCPPVTVGSLATPEPGRGALHRIGGGIDGSHRGGHAAARPGPPHGITIHMTEGGGATRHDVATLRRQRVAVRSGESHASIPADEPAGRSIALRPEFGGG